MEYSFKKSPQSESLTLRLDDYGFILRKDGKEEVFSYASVLSVRITRSNNHVYTLYIFPDDHKPIVITSRCCDENGALIDQSASYSLFVRVLHHHLKEKSRAVFTAGNSPDRIWQWSGISAFVSFIISITASYGGFSLVNPYMLALILTSLMVATIFLLSANKLPKTYKPTEIPLQFLP